MFHRTSRQKSSTFHCMCKVMQYVDFEILSVLIVTSDHLSGNFDLHPLDIETCRGFKAGSMNLTIFVTTC